MEIDERGKDGKRAREREREREREDGKDEIEGFGRWFQIYR